MTDHEDIDEGRRIMALAHLQLTEARARAAVAKSLLTSLANHSRELTPADRHDFAYAMWAEFVGDGGRSTPVDLEASVFAQAALWLDNDTTITLARKAWGDTDLDASDGESRVQWMPQDDMLILTVGHLQSDGSAMQVDMVITPGRMAGAVR